MKDLGLREGWGLAGQIEGWGIGSKAPAVFLPALPLTAWKSFGNSRKKNIECYPSQPDDLVLQPIALVALGLFS